jgi:hypothetical protein
MAIGDIITAARYNNLQSRVATVMGVGSGDDGYGQNLASSQVATNAVVLATDMQTLFTDLANGRIHQTGTQPTEVAFINVSDVILDSDTINKKGVVQFENLTTSLENDKFVIAPSQASAEPGIQAQYTQNWNGTLTHVFDIVFADSDHRRHFFNAGGEIRFASNITYTGTSAKTIDWMTMLVNIGTVKFAYTSTTATGTGTGSIIGFHDLTGTYQQLFIKNGSGNYAANNYKVEGQLQGTTSVRFKVTFNDDNTGNPNTDENVLGTLNSTITQLRATGSAVEVQTPLYSNDPSSNLT